VVRATNSDGEYLATARISQLATARGSLQDVAAVDTRILREVESLLQLPRDAEDATSARLALEPEDLPCFVLCEAAGHETTLLGLGSGEGEIAVPLPKGVRFEIDAGLLSAAAFESGKLTVWPTVLAADGSWLKQGLVLTPRAAGRWAVAMRREQHVTVTSRWLEDLPRGQSFLAFLQADHQRVQFEPLQAVAPARLDFVWRRVPGCTILFAMPLPTAGTIVHTPHDRRHDEPMLHGDLRLAAGATSAFVPCAVGRPWFVDGCGVGWQFAAPLIVEASRDDGPYAVELRDAAQVVAVVGEGGLDPDEIQILFAKGAVDRREFERITFDPMARGPRIVRDTRGWLVRDVSPTMELFAYLESCHAMLSLDVAGRTGVGIQKPEVRPGFRIPDADREVLRAELLSIAEGDLWVYLDQWLPTQGSGMWFPAASCRLPRDQLLAGTVPMTGRIGSRYRLRIILHGRDWTVPLE
jgi:hypothetical protein